MDTWITDTGPWERFPHFTRANADEVGPAPFSPLGWSLVWVRGAGPGAAEGYVTIGCVSPEELAPRHNIFANYGGYFYNTLDLSRLLGVRMPGSSHEAIDRAYFGDHPGVPPYRPDPRDESPSQSEALARSVAWVLSADGYPAMDEAVAASFELQAGRPVLAALSDAELVARARYVADRTRGLWHAYCVTVLAASFGPGAVSEICAAAGRPEAVVALFGAIGGVESTGSSVAIWRLSRLVRSSAHLGALFDAGVTGLLDRLRTDGSGDAATFTDAFDDLLREHGHRGPNEWDIASECWATKPELVLGMVGQLRAQTDDHDPLALAAASATARERTTAELVGHLGGDDATCDALLAAVRSGIAFYQLREAGKSGVVRSYHEVRLALRELGVRYAERGLLADLRDIFLLLDAELDDFTARPSAYAATIEARRRDFEHLQLLEAPYIVDSCAGPPPISAWAMRRRAPAPPAVPGDVLQGAPAAPGRASGRARVVLDPGEAELSPGDVLVCRTTDPSWAPLFLASAGVICDVGAVGSHAAIVARELGVPCAVSVLDATLRLPDGATVEVDGSTGTVTVLAAP